MVNGITDVIGVGDYVRVEGLPIGGFDEPTNVVGVVMVVDQDDNTVDVFLGHGRQWWYRVEDVIPWGDYC